MINHKSNIIVSICCVTYNHASFIRKALDGFLMQEPPSCMPEDAKLSDWCEILIHDDCSTDGTTEIVREYAAKYPDVIFPLYEEVNQFSRGGRGRMDLYNYNRAKGKYIAYCEGDDYWTDPKKLRKQVDWMDAHPEYSICFHNFKVYDVRSNQERTSRDTEAIEKLGQSVVNGKDMTVTDYFKGFGQPLTMLFRMSMLDFGWRELYQYYRDTHEIYHLLRAGKGYWMNFVGGIYMQHNGGISTSVNIDQRCWEEREHIIELYMHNKGDKELRTYLIEILLWNHDVFKREGREGEFFRISKKYLTKIPRIMMYVYWVVMKRDVKGLLH